ncbi:MAG: ribonuclease III [Propionibacteriales bacterium]|nr:ribonuclease III [Propionibacteriales bacterium]
MPSRRTLRPAETRSRLWQFRSGRCRAATRATAVRSGRPLSRRWSPAPTPRACPSTCSTGPVPSAASTAPGQTDARSSDLSSVNEAAVGTSRAQLCATLGVEGLDPELLHRALTHRSFAYENGGLPTNERLEFLGDSVLGIVVTESLYLTHPDFPEGRLAKLRAAVVNARALAVVGRTLGLGDHLLLGRGEEATGGRDKASILSDGVEALIGAIYIDKGFQVAGDVIHRLFDPLMAAAADLGAGLDWKTSLQELSADLGLGVPEYLIDDSGPDHAKTFVARVRVGEGVYGHGTGRSKKEAEQIAAETAWRAIRDEHDAADARPPAPVDGLPSLDRD